MSATVKLLGVACGRGAAQPGAEEGPYVLRQRRLQRRLIAAGHVVEDLGDIPGVYETRFAVGPETVHHLRNVLQVNRHTHACVLGACKRDPDVFLLIIGGDHSLAIGTLAGLADACDRLGLIWIDAHADFNTPLSSPSGNVHGMSLAVACGYGHRAFSTLGNRYPMLREEDVFLLGCRDVDAGEREVLSESAVHLWEMADWRTAGLVPTVAAAIGVLAERCDHVHLSFDLDVLDPAHVPGTGTPVPGGLSVQEAQAVLTVLQESGRVHSAEFVEYNPRLDREHQTADLALELIETLLRRPVE